MTAQPQYHRTFTTSSPADKITRDASQFTRVNVSLARVTSVTTKRNSHTHVKTQTVTMHDGWRIVLDARERVHEVRAHGDDPVARMKLRHHCELIATSAVLTVLITWLVGYEWTHLGGIIPIVPSWLQEFHDWIYKL